MTGHQESGWGHVRLRELSTGWGARADDPGRSEAPNAGAVAIAPHLTGARHG